MEPKLFLKAISQYFGYQIRKTRKASSIEASFLHLDSQYDQKFLLNGSDVKLIFDIGAHVGDTAKNYNKMYPNARIIGFEPFPESFQEFKKNCRSFQQIEPYQLAVAESSGTKTFYSTDFSPQNSLLKLSPICEDYYAQSNASTITSLSVESVTLDSFCHDKNINEIDICKIDIQGAELLALKGAESLLEGKAIKILYLEVQFNEMYESQAWFHDISSFLLEFNYSLFGLYNLDPGNKNNLSLAQGDAIFISPNLLAK